MIRAIFVFCICVLFGRWLYQEAQLLAPEWVSKIDRTLDYVEFPTHDELAVLGKDPLLSGAAVHVEK
jgi:hypothetical protein